MTVLLPYPPSVNRIYRSGTNGVTYQPKKIKDFKASCAWLAKKEGATILHGDIEIFATLHPKITKKGEPSKTRIDLDNALKSVLDGLNGVCYQDDKQIIKIVLEIGFPITNGGVTVSVLQRAK